MVIAETAAGNWFTLAALLGCFVWTAIVLGIVYSLVDAACSWAGAAEETHEGIMLVAMMFGILVGMWSGICISYGIAEAIGFGRGELPNLEL